MWVFGYGSLVWKADFPFESRMVGYIEGYVRRFWQYSIDHRGVPSKPGLVVTLVKSSDPQAQVWGVAYKIAAQDVEFVMNHLDYREKNGYERVEVIFNPCGHALNPDIGAIVVPTEPFQLVVYLANECNESFAGAANIENIAQTIVTSVGPSGPNTEYVYKLASAMRLLAPGVKDEHLFAVEEAVRRLDTDTNRDLL
uniref:glutathione-specific gamma-glutamylcyclotransferase n=2 Tax=Timema TaxID=61471 RepID=A0A7R9P0V0_9NEOP|nr:unnamed protein product [Timema bartmani]CAD7463548.1 unnamed protein product [Timema tahoe]